MKSRLAASIYMFSAGKCWIKKGSPISSRSRLAVFERRQGLIDCSFQARGIGRLNKSVHSSALQDDAFSELDQGESECSPKKISKKTSTKVYDFVGLFSDFVAMKDNDACSESGISKHSAKKIKFVADEHDDFLDDDFSELGPGISESSAKQIKLVTEKDDTFLDNDFSEMVLGISDSSTKKIKLATEKRDHIPKAQSHGIVKPSMAVSSGYKLDIKDLFNGFEKDRTTSATKSHAPVHESISTDCEESASSAPHSDYSPAAKGLLAATTKASKTSSAKLPSRVQAPISTDDAREISEMECPLSVSIKNIPSKVGLPELIEAISVYGRVSGASFVTTFANMKCCNIEFEDADSCRKAILAGKVEVGGDIFQVNSLDDVDLVAVRIKNINENSADSAIHSMCKSVGELVGLKRTSKNVAEAFFYDRNNTSHPDIVKKLNETVLDLNHWSANVLTSISNSSGGNHKNVSDELHQRILHHSLELKNELHLKMMHLQGLRMHLQDLEYLNKSIMHLQCIPPAPVQSGIR